MAALYPCRIGLQLDIPGDHALVNTGAARTLMDSRVFSKAGLKLGRPSLLRPTGMVCGLGGTLLPVVRETDIQLTDAATIKFLVAKDFPH